MLLRLLTIRQLEPDGSGLVRGAHPFLQVGNSRLGFSSPGREAMVKDYGVAMAMPQG